MNAATRPPASTKEMARLRKFRSDVSAAAKAVLLGEGDGDTEKQRPTVEPELAASHAPPRSIRPPAVANRAAHHEADPAAHALHEQRGAGDGAERGMTITDIVSRARWPAPCCWPGRRSRRGRPRRRRAPPAVEDVAPGPGARRSTFRRRARSRTRTYHAGQLAPNHPASEGVNDHLGPPVVMLTPLFPYA